MEVVASRSEVAVSFAVCDDTCIWNYHLIVINENANLAAFV